ncbi:MAG: DUF362 domain-containing protein [Tannerella sp.]|jgi:uncharacterized protein (DUF362 family)|nr:DUF362 domain-containing protein [Tannerella sp.]
MKRRDFLKKSAVAGAGAALTLNFDGLQAALNSNAMVVQAAPHIVAVMGGEPVQLLNRALEELGGIGVFVKKGQKVVIKPNIGWDRVPERAGNTNPLIVSELVKKCLAAGASKVTVFDNTCDTMEKCYAASGIADAVKAAGGVIVPGNEEKYYKEVELPQGVTLKKAKIHEALLDADVWFNVPVLKHHGGTKFTCAMKNYMGIVWDRRAFHSNDLQQCIADVCTWSKKPVLNIVDAYRIVHQNGPQGRSEADVTTVKSLIASTDIVAADTAALRMYNQVKPLTLEEASHIGKGEALKLGTTKLDNLDIRRIQL